MCEKETSPGFKCGLPVYSKIHNGKDENGNYVSIPVCENHHKRFYSSPSGPKPNGKLRDSERCVYIEGPDMLGAGCRCSNASSNDDIFCNYHRIEFVNRKLAAGKTVYVSTTKNRCKAELTYLLDKHEKCNFKSIPGSSYCLMHLHPKSCSQPGCNNTVLPGYMYCNYHISSEKSNAVDNTVILSEYTIKPRYVGSPHLCPHETMYPDGTIIKCNQPVYKNSIYYKDWRSHHSQYASLDDSDFERFCILHKSSTSTHNRNIVL